MVDKSFNSINDAGDYLSSTTDGNCSKDNGDSCKIVKNGNEPSGISLSISGQDC